MRCLRAERARQVGPRHRLRLGAHAALRPLFTPLRPLAQRDGLAVVRGSGVGPREARAARAAQARATRALGLGLGLGLRLGLGLGLGLGLPPSASSSTM